MVRNTIHPVQNRPYILTETLIRLLIMGIKATRIRRSNLLLLCNSWTMRIACVVLVIFPTLQRLSAQDDTLRTDTGAEPMTHWEFTLEDVIVAAQSKSLPAMIAKYSFISSYWEFRSYKAQFLPSLNLNAGLGQYNRSLVPLQDAETGETHYVQNDNMNNWLQLSIDQNIPWTGGIISLNTYLNRFDQFSPYGDKTWNSNPVNIYLQQPIFQYNRLKWERKTEPKKYERSKKKYLEDLEDIAITATRYFFTVLRTQESLEMARRRYENTRQLYDIAQERFNIGTYTKDELLQMELQVLNAEIAVASSEVELRQAMLSLKSYLGMGDDTDLTLIRPQHYSNIEIDEEEAVRRSLENTTFSLDNELNLIEAEAAIAQAKSERGFSAMLTAQFGLTQTGSEFTSSYRNPMDQEIVGLTLSVPILDWGLGKGKVQMARTQQEIVLAQVEQEVMQRRQDIYIRVVQFNAQSQQCDVSQKADAIAGERYELALQRFRNGTIGILEMNTAQNERDEASAQYIEELANYWSYYYNLRKDTLYDYIYGKDLDAEFDKLIED